MVTVMVTVMVAAHGFCFVDDGEVTTTGGAHAVVCAVSLTRP
jgi:hypothetical protein